MTTRTPSPGQLEQSFARAIQLQAELGRKERAIGRKVQVLAKGLAGLMEPGAHLHRTGVGLHAFDVDGAVCLAAAYHEPDGDGYRYRYAVLCGGEAARRALRTAVLDPGDCDEPGPGRRIALATYADYDDFVYRLPKFIADVTRSLEERIQQTEGAEMQIRTARRRLSAAKRSAPTPRS
jgi:hypothetical protein